nr:MAG TPA: hypothetical protein [Caudoviricetes sp.]DAF03264.1 MAG TPA: hypothetical protein [Caudoviricetes sp.]
MFRFIHPFYFFSFHIKVLFKFPAKVCYIFHL